MELTPFIGNEIITSSKVEVRINPDDRKRAQLLVEQTSDVVLVNDEDSFNEARRAASQLKAMLDEIEAARKASKQSFDAVGRAIQDLAQEVGTPVKVEQTRILKLLEAYVTKLEAARREEERLKAEAHRKIQEEADRKIREAQEARDKAQAELRAAQDETQRVLARAEAQERENQLLQQQIERELADEIIVPEEPKRGLVPGGRVDHVYEFELVNVQATTEARCWRLLKWSLDIRACQDSVRAQMEAAPNIEPSLPGIKITKRLNVSVKASSRIK